MIIKQKEYTLNEFLGCVDNNIRRVLITPDTKDMIVEFD